MGAETRASRERSDGVPLDAVPPSCMTGDVEPCGIDGLQLHAWLLRTGPPVAGAYGQLETKDEHAATRRWR